MKHEDSPALKYRSKSYPFGNKVPKTVQLTRFVRPDVCFSEKDWAVGGPGEIHPAWTNSHGAVSAIINGVALGLYPNEFEVKEWVNV